MDNRRSIPLATNANSNLNYPSDAGIQLPGGPYRFVVSGDLRGAAVALQTGGSTGTSFISLANGSFTAANGDYIFEAGRGEYVRLAVTGSGSPSPAINAELIPIASGGAY